MSDDVRTLWDELSEYDKAFYAQFGVENADGLELALGIVHQAFLVLAREPIKFFEASRHATNLLPPHAKLRIMSAHKTMLTAVPEQTGEGETCHESGYFMTGSLSTTE